MRKAVVRLDPDPAKTLTSDVLAAGLRDLTAQGIRPHGRRAAHELEIVLDAEDADQARQRTVEGWRATFGSEPEITAVTLISRGTDDDVAGVLDAFGLSFRLARFEEDGEDIAEVTLLTDDRRRVPESRLHTALEAALNCEVRIRFDTPESTTQS